MIEPRIDKVSATQFDRPGDWIIHLANGETMTLAAVLHDAIAWRERPSAGAVERAVNRSNHAAERAERAERLQTGAERTTQHAIANLAVAKAKQAKIIEQARSWKQRAIAAEAATDRIEHAAMLHERDLRAEHRERLHEAQANALNTIQRIAAQLPVDPIIDAEVVVPDVEVDTWFGEDDTPVVQIDTHRGHGRLRINLNDGVVWDGDPETDERPGKNAELVEWEQRALAQAETISRQLDTIRDQTERIDELEAQHADAINESAEVIRKCNEQLSAMAATAKLRDQQVETLARLWSAAFEETGSPVGAVITRQLYRVMADHGIDVTNMPDY